MRSILFLALSAVVFPAMCNGITLAATVSSKGNKADKVILRWEGHTLLPFEENGSERCSRLIITEDNQARYGKCSEKTRTGLVSSDGMVSHFAPFESRSSDATLSFNGRGKVAGEVWQRAIVTWASYVFSEMYSGHSCASCRNVLEWSFAPVPNRPGYRRMLMALHHGYVRKGQVAIRGFSDWKAVAEGWLTTKEWTQLDSWIQSRTSGSIDAACILVGKGTQEMRHWNWMRSGNGRGRCMTGCNKNNDWRGAHLLKPSAFQPRSHADA